VKCKSQVHAPILVLRYRPKLNSIQVSDNRPRPISHRFWTILTHCHFVATEKATLGAHKGGNPPEEKKSSLGSWHVADPNSTRKARQTGTAAP
jgi:hypothetical protein